MRNIPISLRLIVKIKLSNLNSESDIYEYIAESVIMLCEICQGCLKNPKSMALGLFYGSGTHHSGWLSLKNSAQSDCSICVKVLEEVSNKGLLDTSGHEIMWDMSYHHFGAEIGHMDIHVDSVGPTMIDKFEINFALLPNSGK